MGEIPDARTAIDAVAHLADEIRAALDAPPDLAQADALSTLHAQVLAADSTLRWSRDAALVLAHHAGASWGRLALDADTPDSTLEQRARVWADREGR